MKTILICNQKGGVGKTLIADQLIFLLEKDNIPYSFIDLDQQGGAIHQPVKNDKAVVRVIDTPGALQDNLTKWIAAADMIIVPTKTSLSDQPALKTMIEILKPFHGKKPILYVLNGLNRYIASQQFVEWFTTSHPELKYLPLAQSEAFNNSAAQKKAVGKIKANSIPAQQMAAIYGVVTYELQLAKEGK